MDTIRKCKLSADSFCYVCGNYIGKKESKKLISSNPRLAYAYEAYFRMPIGDQDKSWAPHFSCEYCRRTLEKWLTGMVSSMPFAIPRIWREPTNHNNDCYFCMVDISSYRKPSDKIKISYPSIPSSIAPLEHSQDLPIPFPPNFKVNSQKEVSPLKDNETCYLNEPHSSNLPYFPKQNDLDDLLGLQGGYTTYSCFLCLWDSRADDQHFKKSDWPIREKLNPGTHNVTNLPLVETNKILLPPLHIKLGLIKQFVKALDTKSEAYIYIRSMFPKLSEAKVKGGIFIGPQVRKMLISNDL